MITYTLFMVIMHCAMGTGGIPSCEDEIYVSPNYGDYLSCWRSGSYRTADVSAQVPNNPKIGEHWQEVASFECFEVYPE